MPDAPDRGRPWLPWMLAWVVLTAAGALVHHALWSGHVESENMPALQSVGNALHMAVGAGWIVLRMIRRDWPTDAVSGPLMANAIGWFFALAALWVFLRVVRMLMRAKAAPLPALGAPDSGRRRFLIQGPAAVAALGGSGGLVRGAFVEPWDLKVARYRIPVKDLPEALDGMRIVQLSDTHLGPRIPAPFIRRAVAMSLELRPDLVALTGDYIHYGPVFIRPAAELFRPLVESGIPVAGVLGNHDWYSNGREMSAALRAIGVHMIDNRRVWLQAATRRIVLDPPAGEGICIAGLGDLLTAWVDIPAALAGLPMGMPRIVLSHNPDTAEAVAGRDRLSHYGGMSKGVVMPLGKPRVDLMLSGHTHGGQVRIPFLGTPLVPSRFGQRYAGGLVNGPDGPGFPVIVSRGVGMSILPVRLGVPPEVVEVTLVRA